METFTTVLYHTHSGLRYLVLLAGFLSLAYSLTSGIRSQGWDKPGRIFLSAFVGLLHLQVVLGLILVFLWAFYPALWGHLAMMLLAAVAAQTAASLNKRRSPERQSHWLAVSGVAVALVLIVGGILAIGRPIFG